MVVPANLRENGVWGSPIFNGSSWQNVDLIQKIPPEKAWKPTCQSKEPRQKERMLPVPAYDQWRTHNLYARAVYKVGISPLTLEEKCLFQVCVFSGLVWPKVGILSLDTCFCQKFVNLRQILWSSIFHVCRKSTHGFTRMHRQEGALCPHAVLQILHSFQLNHISPCRVCHSWISHGFLMLWGILWVYKQQIDYIHPHCGRLFLSPIACETKYGSCPSLELVWNASTTHVQLWENHAIFFIVINCFRARLLMYKDEERSQLCLKDNLPFSNVSHFEFWLKHSTTLVTCCAKKAALCYALLSAEFASTCQGTEQSIAIYTGTLFCSAPHMKLMSGKSAQRAWKT